MLAHMQSAWVTAWAEMWISSDVTRPFHKYLLLILGNKSSFQKQLKIQKLSG